MAITNDRLQTFYIAYYGRPADTMGLNYWSTLANTAVSAGGLGGNQSALIQNLGAATQSEFIAVYGTNPATATFLNTVYQNLFGRDIQVAELNYWAGVYNNLTIGGSSANASRSTIVTYIVDGAQGTDAAAIAAKVAYAASFTASLDTVAEITAFGDLNNTAGLATARTAMRTVVDSTTQATATTSIDTTLTSIIASETAVSSPPQTFTLTVGVNSGSAFTGGAGNDTFDGSVSSSLSAGDVLNGGSGTDTLTAVLPAISLTPSLTSVETVNITATGNVTLDLQTSTGYKTLNNNNSIANTVTFNNIADATVAVGITSSSGVGDTTVNYTDAALSGSADTLALTLNGDSASNATALTITDGGGSNKLETVAITATGSASVVGGISTTAVGTTKFTVAGSSNLTVTAALGTAVNSLDATNATGNLKFTLQNATSETMIGGSGNDTLIGGAANDSITGGAGNDSITGGAGNDNISAGDGNDVIDLTFTTSDTIDGGSGTDTLTIAAAVAAATDLTTVTNVETLVVTGANNITLAANVSATTFTVSDAGNASVVTLNSGYTNATTVNVGDLDKVTNNANVELTVAATAANMISGADVTLAGGTGNDTLTLTADGSAALLTNGKITGFETINITPSSTQGSDVVITVDAAYATKLVVNGSSLRAGTAAADETLTFDGSAQSTSSTTLSVSGGAGNDTLTGGAGNDTIAGNAGVDSINGASGGADSITAGDGNDTINVGGALTSADVIDGGSGTDTLIVTSISATALTNVTNVETLAMSGGSSSATLAANLAFTTVDMNAADDLAQTLVLATGYTNATTVAVDAGDTVTNNANVALTVNATGAGMVGTTITGGTGTDTLNITADNGTATFASQLTSINVVNIVDGTAGKDITLTLGAYATALTIDASTLDAADSSAADTTAEILTVSGASATKALTITVGNGGSDITTGSGALNDVVTGGTGTDSITSGGGNDSLVGGDGVDTFVLAGNLTYQDTIAGGSGNDILSITGASAVTDVAFMNVSSIYNLTLTDSGSATLSSYATTAGITTITGFATAANTVSAAGMTTGVTITAATTDNISDNLTGGTANDTFSFSGLTGLETGDSVTGGSGTDTLKIALGTNGVTTEVTAMTNVATIEAITVTGVTAGVNFGAMTLADANFVSVTGAVISFSGVTSNATISFNAALEDDSSFVITGSGATASGNATLVGGSLNDTITGGTGVDSITGGIGADVMTGNGGNDVFIYTGSGFETGAVSPAIVYYGGTVVAGTSVNTGSMDKILDFTAGDTINTQAGASGVNMATNATGSTWTQAAGYLKGAYDSTAQTFTFSTTGSDSLFVYDYDANTSTNDLRAVVLVGYTDSGTTDSNTTGLVGVA